MNVRNGNVRKLLLNGEESRTGLSYPNSRNRRLKKKKHTLKVENPLKNLKSPGLQKKLTTLKYFPWKF